MQTVYGTKRTITENNEHIRENIPCYICNAKYEGKVNCNNTKRNKVKIEQPVLEAVESFLDRLSSVDLRDDVINKQQASLKQAEKAVDDLLRKADKTAKEITNLEDEVIKVLDGSSSFSRKTLSALITKKQEEQDEIKNRLIQEKEKLQQSKLEQEDYTNLEELIPIWKDELRNAPFEVQKVLLSKLIDKIEIYPDNIKVTFYLDMKRFEQDALLTANRSMRHPSPQGVIVNLVLDLGKHRRRRRHSNNLGAIMVYHCRQQGGTFYGQGQSAD